MKSKTLGTMVLSAAFAAVIALSSCTAFAQAGAIIKHDFEENDGGWMAVGTGGKVAIAHEAANVKTGKSALQFDYFIEKGLMSALTVPTPDAMLAKAKSIRFWVKSDTGGTLAAVLQEKDGGRYVSMFTAPAAAWQQVELSAADFVLSEDANDPPDPDGKLDLEAVDSISIVDVAQILAQADNVAIEKLFGVKRGAHVFYLDDFSVSESALPAPAAIESGISLDAFLRPQVAWLPVGGMKLAQVSSAPLTGRGLQIDYHQAAGSVAGVFRKIPRGSLIGKSTISFDIASVRPIKLVIQVEEKTGGKYNVLMDIAGGKALKTISLPFSDFKASDDSKDTNDKLDLDQVTQVVLIDANALLNMTDGDNTLWIGNLRATAAK